MVSVRYLDPTTRTFDESLVGWLLAELPAANRLRFATAYFDASVLDWLQEPFEELIDRSGSVQALIGSNGGQTSRTDLERFLRITEPDAASSLHVEYAEGGIFHPKVFVVEQADAVKAVVGSANLTTNGSLVNVEAGIAVSTDIVGPPTEQPLDMIVRSIDSARANAFEVRASDDLERLERLGIIGRVVRRAASNVTQGRAERQRERRRRQGVRTRTSVSGIPPRTRRPTPAAPVPTGPPRPAPTAAIEYYGLEFSANDLKDTGTREISVSSSLRAWAATLLGRSIQPGDGTLFELIIEGRLAGSPASVTRTPEPVRIWAAGGSGGTHQDVRLVLGSHLKTALDDEAVGLTGLPIPPDSIGVFELPRDPNTQEVRLTVFLPSDSDYPTIEALLGRTGREQKEHFRVASLPAVPPWP